LPSKTEQLIAYTDGASRGNPGPAAAGFVLCDSAGTQLQARAFFIGQATNNVAEYTAVIKALEAAKQLAVEKIEIFSDSELFVRQVNGEYRVKSQQLKDLFRKTIELLGEFKQWQVQHVPRKKNEQADRIVNQALDLGCDFELNVAADNSLVCSSQKENKTKPPKKPVRLGVLISGGGTTSMNILEYIKTGRLNAEIALVISSRSTVAGVEKAKNAGLNVKIIRKNDFPDIDKFSERIKAELIAAKVDLVIQAGWLCLWKIPKEYTDRVMNIHPALLPSFGGKGMWGHHVHQAVLNAGCKISGCTVHFCTNEYDRGPIIVQRCCQVKDDDSPQSLAERVFLQECIAYPEAIKLFAEDKLLIQNGKVKIKSRTEPRTMRKK
jgi:formyltetrahydrofolate-dependent phosphoribosylglycinamide formyltransferase